MNHVVLAGDSIFDNAAYVERGQSVIEQLLAKANNDFDSTLVAVDGSITSELAHQFRPVAPRYNAFIHQQRWQRCFSIRPFVS